MYIVVRNKFDFIKEVLGDKKITPSQKERVLLLATKELKIVGSIEERVKILEEKILGGNEPPEPPDPKTPKYINPYYLYEFLREYNQNEILRSTCHDSDENALETIKNYCSSEEYFFEMHLNKIIESYKKHEEVYKNAPYQIRALIRGYLTGKDFKGNELLDGWSANKIKISWSSKDVKDWAKQNPNMPPNINQELAGSKEISLLQIKPQVYSPISKELISNFTRLVLHFKDLFHIRGIDQSLKNILQRYNEFSKLNEKLDIEFDDENFLNNLELFTDVDKLLQAYKKIIDIIIKQHSMEDRPKVLLKFFEEDKIVYFSILHINGRYNKSLNSTLERPYGQDYSMLIKKQINGLCNLILRADFDNGDFAEVNLWNGKEVKPIPLPIFQGVEHILIFPKINLI